MVELIASLLTPCKNGMGAAHSLIAICSQKSCQVSWMSRTQMKSLTLKQRKPPEKHLESFTMSRLERDPLMWMICRQAHCAEPACS